MGPVIAACVGWILVGLTTFTRFDAVGIEIREPFPWNRRVYDYSRVTAIEHRASYQAPGGTFRRSHHVVVFDDGTTWSTRDGIRSPVPERDQQIAQLIREKSGQEIVEMP